MSSSHFADQPQPHSDAIRMVPARPTSATVFGVLNILFGVLGFCGIGAALISLVIPPGRPTNSPVIGIIERNPLYHAYTLISSLVSIPFVIALVAGGIGLLMGRMWGRTLSIVYAIYAMISTVIGLIFNWILVWEPLMEIINTGPAGPQKAAALGGIAGGVFGTCLAFIYPVVLLIFMSASSFKSALRAYQAAIDKGTY
ncbi:MAG: hypothetical protein KatS3mg105_3558 [Gemmatales bacterium]|nr:MAG: hypothetical protein KatS3mg105_3558 [Gemmatales bacterium]